MAFKKVVWNVRKLFFRRKCDKTQFPDSTLLPLKKESGTVSMNPLSSWSWKPVVMWLSKGWSPGTRLPMLPQITFTVHRYNVYIVVLRNSTSPWACLCWYVGAMWDLDFIICYTLWGLTFGLNWWNLVTILQPLYMFPNLTFLYFCITITFSVVLYWHTH